MQITFLVGNGFDIAAGLNSSYGAFYAWYCTQPSGKKHIERFKREIADDVRSGGKNWSDFEVGLGKYTARFTPENAEKDAARDAYLQKMGITVLRYPNTVVNQKFDDVCRDILVHLDLLD